MPRISTLDQVLRVQHHLTHRDWRLLGWLYDHRVMTSFQIAHALFPSLNYAQRRLTELTNLGLLERFRPFRLDGGSHPYHYALAHLGAMAVAGSRTDPPPGRGDTATRLHRIATSPNLHHRLGINQFFTDLAGHERTHPNARLHHWWPDNGLERFSPPGETPAYLMVHADALGVWSENERTVAFYFEHDTGTEALTVLVDKIERYGSLTRAAAGRWPVVFWLHSTIREAHLHQRLTTINPAVDIVTAARDRLEDHTPAEHIWKLYGAAQPLLRLADIPMRQPVDLQAFDEANRDNAAIRWDNHRSRNREAP